MSLLTSLIKFELRIDCKNQSTLRRSEHLNHNCMVDAKQAEISFHHKQMLNKYCPYCTEEQRTKNIKATLRTDQP